MGQNSQYTFLGFIYNPAIAIQQTYPTMRKGPNGDSVRWLQRRLQQLGYYTGVIDGHFGKQTLGAVLAFQMEHGLEVDGICGLATQAALS